MLVWIRLHGSVGSCSWGESLVLRVVRGSPGCPCQPASQFAPGLWSAGTWLAPFLRSSGHSWHDRWLQCPLQPDSSVPPGLLPALSWCPLSCPAIPPRAQHGQCTASAVCYRSATLVGCSVALWFTHALNWKGQQKIIAVWSP